jgi:hypothetical protein
MENTQNHVFNYTTVVSYLSPVTSAPIRALAAGNPDFITVAFGTRWYHIYGMKKFPAGAASGIIPTGVIGEGLAYWDAMNGWQFLHSDETWHFPFEWFGCESSLQLMYKSNATCSGDVDIRIINERTDAYHDHSFTLSCTGAEADRTDEHTIPDTSDGGSETLRPNQGRTIPDQGTLQVTMDNTLKLRCLSIGIIPYVSSRTPEPTPSS